MNDKNQENDAIPASLQLIMQDIKTVCSELNAEGEFQQFSSDQWIYHLDSVQDSSISHVALVLDGMESLIAVYVLLRMPETEALQDKIESIVQAVSFANYGLLPGCFETDLETGETRYRSVLQITSNGIGTQDIAQLISNALLVAQKYAPAVQAIVNADIDPIRAIEEVED